jgi:NADH-quinone oxidoreductase subunit G
VLRVLGTLLEAPGFELNTLEEVRAACVEREDLPALSNKTQAQPERKPASVSGIQRIADVPIYFADPLVRRSPPLQKTRDAQPPKAWMNARLMQKLGVAEGQPVLVKQGEGAAKLMAALDERLPEDCVRVSAAHPATASLGAMFGSVTLEKLSLQQAA